ncbi:AzlD domain-containing protein, partial [Glycomyces tenuis]
MTWIDVAVLAVGTFLIRLSGPLLRGRVDLSEETEEFLKRGATVVLVALVATSSVMVENEWAGWA